MDEALQAHFGALDVEVGAAAIPDDSKHAAFWCLGQLPALYAKYSQTKETRYAGEITRLVLAVLKGLIDAKAICPDAPKLATGISARLRILHEQLGLPGLDLRSLAPAAPRSRKAS